MATPQLIPARVSSQVANATGSTVASGDLVVADPGADTVAIFATRMRDKSPAVVTVGGANGQPIMIATAGRHTVRVLQAQQVNIGDRLVASATAKLAMVDNDARSGLVVLGVARTEKTAGIAGTVVVDLGVGSGGSRNRLDFVDDFGADPNKGGTFVTCDQAWQDYLDSLEVDSYGLSGGTIHFPHGHFYFEDDIIIPRAIIIDGTGGGFAGRSMTAIHTALGKEIFFSNFDSFSLDASGAILRNVNVLTAPPANFAQAGHGIRMNSAGYCENVFVGYVGKNAFHIETGLDPANANDWFLYRCTASNIGVADRPDYNTGNGIWVKGGDTNAGGSLRFRGFNCLESCIHDESFLGNSHIDPHAEACGRAYRTGQLGTSRVVFNGAYDECPLPDLIYSPAMLIGGILEGGVGDSTGVVLADGGFMTQWNSQWRGSGAGAGNPAGTESGTMTFSRVNGQPVVFGFRSTREIYGGIDFKFNYYAGHPYWYAYDYGDGAGGSFMISGEDAEDVFWPEVLKNITPNAIGGNRPGFGEGFYHGHSWWHHGIAAPTAGENAAGFATWNKYDRRWASAGATIGAGKDGWVCTHSGTFGTYSEGRTATATGTNVITLNSASTVLLKGRVITVNGVTARISAVSGTSLTLVDEDKGGGSRNVGAGSGLAIVFSPPTFAEF